MGRARAALAVLIALLTPSLTAGTGQAQADVVATVGPIEPEPAICWLRLGDPGDLEDDGIYIHARDTSGDGDPRDDEQLATHDVRLVTVLGRAPGTMVGDADVVERTAQARCGDLRLDWIDADHTGTYASQDWLYAGLDETGRLGASQPGAQGRIWVRLTTTRAVPAGTVVQAGDEDIARWEGQGGFPGELALFDADGDEALGPGDAVLVVPRTLSGAAPVPRHSVLSTSARLQDQPVQRPAGDEGATPGPEPTAEPEPIPQGPPPEQGTDEPKAGTGEPEPGVPDVPPPVPVPDEDRDPDAQQPQAGDEPDAPERGPRDEEAPIPALTPWVLGIVLAVAATRQGARGRTDHR